MFNKDLLKLKDKTEKYFSYLKLNLLSSLVLFGQDIFRFTFFYTAIFLQTDN